MISPELLRRHRFFSHLSHEQLKAIAMLANEVSYQTDETLFQIDHPADKFCFLVQGSVDLHYIVKDQDNSTVFKDFFVGHVNPGEPMGISALIEPYIYTVTAQSSSPCHVLEFEAVSLRKLCEVDVELTATLMRHTAQVAMSRLRETRIQLAAARA